MDSANLEEFDAQIAALKAQMEEAERAKAAAAEKKAEEERRRAEELRKAEEEAAARRAEEAAAKRVGEEGAAPSAKAAGKKRARSDADEANAKKLKTAAKMQADLQDDSLWRSTNSPCSVCRTEHLDCEEPVGRRRSTSCRSCALKKKKCDLKVAKVVVPAGARSGVEAPPARPSEQPTRVESSLLESPLDSIPAPPKTGRLGSMDAVHTASNEEVKAYGEMWDGHRKWEELRRERDTAVSARLTKRLIDAAEVRMNARFDRLEALLAEVLERTAVPENSGMVVDETSESESEKTGEDEGEDEDEDEDEDEE
ncbi:hypothetical protein PUNSTDRAFT_139721 [Punctularia strigosozonata HHB-11173 SS5]|uniref:Zn(2)-C6 fungal-type domain-containing protein n=1 Tax=Punctularia strigosozonata (strain HHB-11173) TaxID=741275 RepID=R7RZ57_PUNST|nr:uncharacterized protein PUNSTDRAFT_139721 [Punctularia strigosozonata HHB-11173 SS5]EIN03258.1 hypothetical protein PUNSTDRAFT_139721 [Punctularia strigosozonata HHB-11173 SS5]